MYLKPSYKFSEESVISYDPLYNIYIVDISSFIQHQILYRFEPHLTAAGHVKQRLSDGSSKSEVTENST